MIQNIGPWFAQPPTWVILGLVVVLGYCLLRRRRPHDSLSREDREAHSADFPFLTTASGKPADNPEDLQNRMNQLEDILRLVYRKLDDRSRELEHKVTSLEAAVALVECPSKATAARCDYGSRLLTAGSGRSPERASQADREPASRADVDQ